MSMISQDEPLYLGIKNLALVNVHNINRKQHNWIQILLWSTITSSFLKFHSVTPKWHLTTDYKAYILQYNKKYIYQKLFGTELQSLKLP